jgi:GNAT superfamily N-acetyltransferase
MIRDGVLLDSLRCCGELGPLYAAEARYHDSLTYDVEFCMTTMALSLKDPDNIFLVAVREGIVIGFLWGQTSYLPWSKELIATDNVFYILPEFRGGLYGVKLIRRYEEIAKERGAKQIALSIASGITEGRTSELYTHLGYHKVGIQHRKEL